MMMTMEQCQGATKILSFTICCYCCALVFVGLFFIKINFNGILVYILVVCIVKGKEAKQKDCRVLEHSCTGCGTRSGSNPEVNKEPRLRISASNAVASCVRMCHWTAAAQRINRPLQYFWRVLSIILSAWRVCRAQYYSYGKVTADTVSCLLNAE